MWGCGSDKALESQRSQKKWEAGAISREQSRKVRFKCELCDLELITDSV